jgi:hypothetical protein
MFIAFAPPNDLRSEGTPCGGWNESINIVLLPEQN